MQSVRELFVETVELIDQKGTARRYDYFILIGEMDVGAYACESYGIKVSEQGGPQAQAENVTCSAARIDELSDLMIRNGVTPATFDEVLSDWL